MGPSSGSSISIFSEICNGGDGGGGGVNQKNSVGGGMGTVIDPGRGGEGDGHLLWIPH